MMTFQEWLRGQEDYIGHDPEAGEWAERAWQAATTQHREVMEDALDGLSTFMEGGPLNCKRVSKAIQSLKQALEV